MSIDRQNSLKLQKRVEGSTVKNIEVREFMNKDLVTITENISIIDAIH